MSLLNKKRKLRLKELPFNLTSLIDVLTVLIFFLIQIFTVNTMNITVPQGMKLPEAKMPKSVEESVSLMVTDKGIGSVEKLLVPFEKGNVPARLIDTDGRTIVPLRDYLQAEFAKRNKVYAQVTDKSLIPEGRLLFYADKKLEFATLKYVLHTAAIAGYTSFHFLASQGESK